MSQFISAGVYTLEKDLSAYVADLAATIVGMVGTSDKGPTNSPTLITSSKQFADIFGDPNPRHYLGYAAMAYLKKGTKIWITRVSSGNAHKAATTFVLPTNYTPYAGSWKLESQNDTTGTFTVSCTDFSTLDTGSSSKTVKLDAATHIPKFNFTDTGQTDNCNSLLGADLDSFVTLSREDLIIGNKFQVTLGPGSGNIGSVEGMSTINSKPALTITSPSFPITNSPTTAIPAGTISVTNAVVTPAHGTALCVIGKSTDSTPIVIKLLADVTMSALTGATESDKVAALRVGLTSPVSATRLAALELVLTAVNSTTYNINVPLLGDTVTGWAKAFLLTLNDVLNALIITMNETVPSGTYPKCVIFWNKCKSAVTGYPAIFALGNNSFGGIRASSIVTDNAGAAVSVRITSGGIGANGQFSINDQTPAVHAILTVVGMEISGDFSLTAHRPTWDMTLAGTASYIPTYIKISSIGEGDFSDITTSIAMDINNKSNTGEQKYTLRAYSRIQSPIISTSSYKLGDFELIEQYDGTIEEIQTNVATASRKISVKIDYATNDVTDYSTGEVTHDLIVGDSLTPSFVMTAPDIGEGSICGSSWTDGLTTSGIHYRLLDNYLNFGTLGDPINKGDIIGSSSYGTGLNSFFNPEEIDINLLLAPGWSADPSVAKEMVSLCEARGDSMAIIDTPFGLSVQEVTNFRRNILNLSTSYGAIYYPWIKITDAINKKDIFVPPSGYVAGQYAYNDLVGDVYNAPAGRIRGNIISALTSERRLTLGDRDILYLNQINPLHNESGFGVYIKGQQTLQSFPTALDRVNVRRLLLKLRKVIATASKSFEFEPGDNVTALRLKNMANTIMEDHLRKGAIWWYNIDVGPNVNTVFTRENNELHMEIQLVPVKTAEKIIETFTILPQSAGGVFVNG